MSGVTREDRRTLIALMCKVAWADGRIDESEREYVQDLITRLSGEPVNAEELDSWLTSGVPDEELGALHPTLEHFFFDESLRLAQADGDLDDRELAVVEAEPKIEGRNMFMLLGPVKKQEPVKGEKAGEAEAPADGETAETSE